MLSKKERFRLVCRGAIKRIRKDLIKYECILLHRKDPYLILGPFKIEILSSSPIRLLMHHIFDDPEVEWLKQYSSELLDTPARLVHPEMFGNISVSSQSNSVVLYLNSPHIHISDSIRLNKIYARISLATSLHSTPGRGSEPLRMSTYGLAGKINILVFIVLIYYVVLNNNNNKHHF